MRVIQHSIRVIQQEGKMDLQLKQCLIKSLKASGYVSKDDDLKTNNGLIQTAIYVVDRMADDMASSRRAR